MSEIKPFTVSQFKNGLAVLAAFVSSFFGYEHGGWPGAFTAAIMAFGGVHLTFAAIAIAWRILVGGLLLLLVLASLKSRWDWLASLAQ